MRNTKGQYVKKLTNRRLEVAAVITITMCASLVFCGFALSDGTKHTGPVRVDAVYDFHKVQFARPNGEIFVTFFAPWQTVPDFREGDEFSDVSYRDAGTINRLFISAIRTQKANRSDRPDFIYCTSEGVCNATGWVSYDHHGDIAIAPKKAKKQ